MIFFSHFADKPATDFWEKKSCKRWLISFLEYFNFAWFFLWEILVNYTLAPNSSHFFLYWARQGRQKVGTMREIHTGVKKKKGAEGALFWLDISALCARFLASIEIHPPSESLVPALEPGFETLLQKTKEFVGFFKKWLEFGARV